jgi:hypothetical protein
MLAAVEIYNKPTFTYREDSFAILATNAWELLLKARILQIDGNRLAAILEYERRRLADGSVSSKLYRKKNRAGNHVTVGLFRAHDRLVKSYKASIDPAVRQNLEALVEIRDNAVHFFNDDLGLTTSIHEIGAASLKNYLAALRQWFGLTLSEHRIFLMPLAFFSGVRVAEGLVLNSEERHVLSYLERVKDSVDDDDVAKDFNVALTIEVKLKRTKEATAVPTVVTNAPDALRVSLDEEDIRERYPWSYDILTARLRKRYANFKMDQRYHELRREFEKDPALCRERLLDPGNPKGVSKRFYSANIQAKFDPHYTRAKPEPAPADTSSEGPPAQPPAPGRS